MGDFSEESITVLSFAGNMVAAVANVDALFDLRDLAYDVTHWGEDEYFVFYLATDVIALLPVVGVVKYFQHFKTVANAVDQGTDLVDSVADISKNGDATVEAVDLVSAAAKNTDNLAEAIETAKDLSKLSDDMAETVCNNIENGYDLLKTRNFNLVGKTHEVTGVEFNLRKLEYSDGKLLQGVFPVFESFADVRLPKDLYLATFEEQKEYCMEQLQRQTRWLFGKDRKNFTAEQLEDIANGILPEGFTWHHNEEQGLMQLVETAVHAQTGHTGGMSIWGQGYDCGAA